MKLREFTEKLLKDIGVNTEELSESLESIGDASIPDNVEEKFHATYLTVERAANHDKVRSLIIPKAKAEALNRIDGAFSQSAQELGLSEDVVEAINNEKSTFEKEKIYKKAINERFNMLKTSGNKEAKSEIDRLQGEVAQYSKSIESLKASQLDEMTSFKRDVLLDNTLLNHPDWKGSVYETEQNRHLLAKAKLQEVLAKHDAQLNFDLSTQSFGISKKGSDDLDVYDSSGNKIGYTEVLNLAMEQYKPKANPNGSDGGNNTGHETRHKSGTGTARKSNDKFNQTASAIGNLY